MWMLNQMQIKCKIMNVLNMSAIITIIFNNYILRVRSFAALGEQVLFCFNYNKHYYRGVN